MSVRATFAAATALLALCASAQSDEEPAPPAAMSAAASFSSGGRGSLADVKRFADAHAASEWDLSRAARVADLVVERDGAKLTLQEGYVFRRPAVEGLTYEVQFVGKARFELSPPVPVERQQVRRFLGRDTVDLALVRAEISFVDADLDRRFSALDYQPGLVEAARATHLEALEWLADTRKDQAHANEMEEARRRIYGFGDAMELYNRLVQPSYRGSLAVHGTMDEDAMRGPGSYPIQMSFTSDPRRLEENSFSLRHEHGDARPWSRVTAYHSPDQYAGGDLARATSDLIENEVKNEFGLAKNRLVLRLEPSGKPDTRMTTDMELVALEDDRLVVNLSVTPLLGATSCRVDGKEAPFFHPAIPGAEDLHAGTVRVWLPQPTRKGQRTRIELELAGDLMVLARDGDTFIMKEEDDWFPNPNVGLGAMPTLFDTTLVTPKGFTAVSNGAEKPCEGVATEPGWTCVRHVVNVPITFATFNASRSMSVVRGNALDGTPIGVYSPPSYGKTAEAILQKARLAHATYEKWFGDSPYDCLWLTPHPKPHGRGSPTMLLLWSGAYSSSTAKALWYRVYQAWTTDAFISHEIAHQWWGGLSGIRSSRDQWFSEGFADYASLLVLEEHDRVNGTKWFYQEMSNWKDALLGKDPQSGRVGYVNDLAPLALGSRVNSSENHEGFEGAYSWYVYNKGGWVMHMLRTLARARTGDPAKGDALFAKAMHDFLDTCRAGHVPSNLDLERSLATSYGAPAEMAKFFEQWVYGLGVPKIEFSYQVVPAAGGKGTMLRGRVRQKDTDFRFPIAVVLHAKGAKGDPPFFYQDVTRADHRFEVGPLPFAPDKVTVNDDYGVLAEIKTVSWQGD
jgi:hypothetical protein